MNVDPSNGKSEIIELKRTGKILQVRWIPLPEQDDWKNGADGHQAILRRIPALADHEAGRVSRWLLYIDSARSRDSTDLCEIEHR